MNQWEGSDLQRTALNGLPGEVLPVDESAAPAVFTHVPRYQVVLSDNVNLRAEVFRASFLGAKNSSERSAAFKSLEDAFTLVDHLNVDESMHEICGGYEEVALAIASMFDAITKHKRDALRLLQVREGALQPEVREAVYFLLASKLDKAAKADTRKEMVRMIRDAAARPQSDAFGTRTRFRAQPHELLPRQRQRLLAELVRQSTTLSSEGGPRGREDTQAFLLRKAWRAADSGEGPPTLQASKSSTVTSATIEALPSLSTKRSPFAPSAFDFALDAVLCEIGAKQDLEATRARAAQVQEVGAEWRLLWRQLAAQPRVGEKAIVDLNAQGEIFSAHRRLADSYNVHNWALDEGLDAAWKLAKQAIAIPPDCVPEMTKVLSRALDDFLGSGKPPSWDARTTLWMAHTLLDLAEGGPPPQDLPDRVGRVAVKLGTLRVTDPAAKTFELRLEALRQRMRSGAG